MDILLIIISVVVGTIGGVCFSLFLKMLSGELASDAAAEDGADGENTADDKDIAADLLGIFLPLSFGIVLFLIVFSALLIFV